MINFIEKILAIGIVLGLSTGAQAQTAGQKGRISTESSLSTALDCTKIEIKIDKSDQPLTAAERAALMDKAFYESLSRFDRCQAARASSGGANSGSGAGAGTGGGHGSAGGGAGTGTVESVASQSMQGTLTEEKVDAEENQSVASQSVKGTLPEENDDVELKAQPELEKDKKLTNLENKEAAGLGSGKLPDDIPPVDNDSVLQKQIRTAAMAEKDKVIKAKLWNEYRKYKGLPLVKTDEQLNP